MDAPRGQTQELPHLQLPEMAPIHEGRQLSAVHSDGYATRQQDVEVAQGVALGVDNLW